MSMSTDNKYLIALTAMLGTFMEVVDTSVANVALPHMAGTFSAGVDEITWVITSYLVANAIILPLTGWLGNFFGRKRLYLTCLVVFILASLGSGAHSIWHFHLHARGPGSRGAMVLCPRPSPESFPRHGKAMAIFGIGVPGPIMVPARATSRTPELALDLLHQRAWGPADPASCSSGTEHEAPEGQIDYASFHRRGSGSLEVS
jgi:DHA2 family multidrug resistance protein